MARNLAVRVSDEEMELWKEAAWTRRASLSSWVRAVLTATAKSTLSIPSQDKQVEEKTVAAVEKCPLQVPRGTKCKACGKVH